MRWTPPPPSSARRPPWNFSRFVSPPPPPPWPVPEDSVTVDVTTSAVRAEPAVSSAMAVDGLLLCGGGRTCDDASDEANDEQSLKPLSLRASNDRRSGALAAVAVVAAAFSAAAVAFAAVAGPVSLCGGDGDDDDGDGDDSPADSSSLRLAILNCWKAPPPPPPPRLLAAESVAILPRARMALPVFCVHATQTRTHARQSQKGVIENKNQTTLMLNNDRDRGGI